MPACVLDASATFPWLFKDEATQEADALLARVAADGAIVPALWFTEVENGLGMAERRGRLTQGGVAEAIALLRTLPLTLDNPAFGRAFSSVLDLMRTHRLTAYDATYLELAIRRDLPLASSDADLRKAARKVGLDLLAV